MDDSGAVPSSIVNRLSSGEEIFIRRSIARGILWHSLEAVLQFMAHKKSPSSAARDREPSVAVGRLLNQRNVLIGFGIVCLLALGVFAIRASSRSTAVDSGRADPANPALVARGKQVYVTRCASCHASDLKGEQGWPERRPNGVMPASPLDQGGTAWQRGDQWLFTTIKQGGQATAPPGSSSSMPAFGGGLTDGDIWAVLSYIKSTWPQQIQDAQPRGVIRGSNPNA
jgi:mono/diheme cytochrome c family protein